MLKVFIGELFSPFLVRGARPTVFPTPQDLM